MPVARHRMRPRAAADWGLVLAGGDGLRLQALTRKLAGAPIPKQYCRLAGDRSFRLDTMLSLLRQRRPSDYDHLARIDETAYASMTPWNFSRDFLTHVTEALVVLQVGDVGWSDLGTPEAVERTLLAPNRPLPGRNGGRSLEAAA